VRDDLPTGTVTFLFTDVEGSTKLLHELGAEEYAQALTEHRRIVREACAAQGGVEVDTQGDAFFFAFPTAPGALAAARVITERLGIGPIRLRIGLHTGTPLLMEEGYVGDDVHRAARIAASGHGGQVLVSLSTASLVEQEDLRNLGEHRFKDLTAPESVYQLGEGDFPALKSLYRTNLPVPATLFLGRERELHEVVSLLSAGKVRLLTLTGPGGTGKTRLALQAAADAAERFPDGITWVPLAPLRDPSLLLSTIAQALDVREEPGTPLLAALTGFLEHKKLLVLLDNVEHLLPDAAGDLAHLASTPGPSMLVTSRERLQLQGEQLYPVPTLLESDGVELFIARARALKPGFDGNGAISELCSRLDHLPLALELAAARTTLFSPGQLLERLSQRLDLLKGGRDADPRQQTLRATIEWSYDLLDSDEQRLFRSLSVFAGGCTFEAAEEVCGADPDTLQSLLDKSLLRRLDSELGSRYWMLETVRDYAAEQLAASGELQLLRNRHLGWIAMATFAQARPARNYEPEASAFFRLEHANVRDGLHWAIESGAAESGHRIVEGAWFYWITRGLASEGDDWAMQVAALPAAPTELYVDALSIAGEFARFRGDYARALPLKERAIAILEDLGPEKDSVAGLLAATHTDISSVLARLGDLDRAAEHAESALAIRHRLGTPHGIAHALGGVADVAERRQAWSEALDIYAESVSLLETVGEPLEAVSSLIGIGSVQRSLGDLGRATEALEDALRRSVESGDRYQHMEAVRLLGLVAADEEDCSRAVRLLSQANEEARDSGLSLDNASEVESALARCRATLGGERYEDAYKLGVHDAARAFGTDTTIG
jgi:predicted ATPase/class 3 adenylate cyclase